MATKHRPLHPVPELTPAQIELHGGITANRETVSLKAALALYPDRKPPKEVMLALKQASIARTLADASDAAKAGTLRKLTRVQPKTEDTDGKKT